MANIPFLNNVYFAGKVGIKQPIAAYDLDIDGSLRVTGSTLLSSSIIQVGNTDYSQINLVTTGTGYLENQSATGGVGIRTGGANPRLVVDSAGAIKFNEYGAGFLVTDASGNITASTSGYGGPYLPLTGGTLTGALSGTSASFSGGVVLKEAVQSGNNSLEIQYGTTITSANNRAKIGTTSYQGLLELWNSGNTKQVNITANGDSYINGGNVGIGTTSPGALMELDSKAAANKVFLRARYNNDFYTDYSTNGIDFVGTSQTFSFKDNGNTVVKIDSGGNVGIGNTNPTSMLTVGGTGDARRAIYATADGASGVFDIGIQGTGTGYGIIGQGTSGGLGVYGGSDSGYGGYFTSATGYGLLVANGNVGIGNTSPTYPLSVKSSTAGKLYGDFEIQDTSTDGPFMTFHEPGSKAWSIGITSSSADLSFREDHIGGAARMVILSGGNVGIGTTDPITKFTVNSGVARTSTAKTYTSFIHSNDTDGYLFGLATALKGGASGATRYASIDATTYTVSSGSYSGENPLVLQSNGGNVGIGTTSPGNGGVIGGKSLHVSSSGENVGVRVENITATIPGYAVFASGSNAHTLWGTGAKPYNFYTNSVLRFTIGATGAATFYSSVSAVDGNFSGELSFLKTANINYPVAGIKHNSNDYLYFTGGINGALFGNSDQSVRMQVNPTSMQLFTSGSPKVTISSSGAATFTSTVTATNFILSSDKRLKENIKELKPNKINVNWKSFNLKNAKEDYRVGVIAQELEMTNPEFVVTNDEGFKSVKYIDLLISKIAELEDRIKNLEK